MVHAVSRSSHYAYVYVFLGITAWWLAAGGLAAPSAAAATSPAACQALDQEFSKTSDGEWRAPREVSVYGRARTLRVAADASAPSAAAAALHAAALRALLRYRRVALASHASACALASALQTHCEDIDSSDTIYDELVLAPSMAWSGRRCLRLEWCLRSVEVSPRAQALGRGAAPARARLLLHLTPAAAALALCRDALLWVFYADPALLERCGFTCNERALSTSAVMYTLPDQKDVTLDMKHRIESANLYLKMTALEDEGNQRRHLHRLLEDRKFSFLFLDYDMWSDMPGVYRVQPPPPTNFTKLPNVQSLQLADDFVLRQIAPQTLHRFTFTPSNIREVLEIEEATPEFGIEEAACSWALKHMAEFQSWNGNVSESFKHNIMVFLCENDSDKYEYKKIARAVERMYNSDLELEMHFLEIDCRNRDELSNTFIKASMSHIWQRLIGVVGAGEGAATAAALAPGLQAALLLYDTPGAAVRLGTGVSAASGTALQLAAAIQHFVEHFEWTRLAIMSDDTELATSLVQFFSSSDNKLKVHEVRVNTDVLDALKSLANLNAKIFFVNTGPDTAQIIMCAAHKLGMTSSEEYVWILRERRAFDLRCGNESDSVTPSFSHLTISFWWRGGDYYEQIVNKTFDYNRKKHILHNTLDSLWRGETWPPLAAPLADSLETLIKSFKKFTELYPEKYFDLHGDGSVRLLLDSLKSHESHGVIQNLKYENGSLSEPLIFIDRWTSNQRQPLSVWRLQNGKFQIIINMNNTFANKRPSDGAKFCLFKTSNKLFNPKCYDHVWFIALGLLVLACLLLDFSLKLRLKRLAKKDCLLTAQLLAQRESVSNALVDHYVDRAALELSDYLGHGCFGRVRFGIFQAPNRQPISVAVKELRDDIPLTEERELLREACTLATLYHDHIVRLIGVCASGGPLLVLMEYAFFGNLCEYLYERRHLADQVYEIDIEENDEAYHVSAPALTRLAREAASALAYLTLQRLVHRDVRASNCLIDSHRSLKLADFGLARNIGTGITGEDEYLTRRRGLFPVLWMAPESLERGVFSAASDAWALGVLLLELATLGARPYGAWPPTRVLRYVSAGGRPPLPPDISDSTRRILVQCWRRVPEDRLTAEALLTLLNEDPEALRPALLPVLPPIDEECPAIDSDLDPTSIPTF